MIERAILVHVYPSQSYVPEDVEEFKSLAKAANVDVVEFVAIPLRESHAKYLIGSGKAEEIQELAKLHKPDLVIINHAISPAQERNLSRLWECHVVDRTGLILDIFAQRARTYEGKLQVELAQLNYLASRLVRAWTHLERQKGGIGLRGPGESQLETDKRLIKIRIRYLKERLSDVRKQREQSRRARQRSDTPTVSLVGYTNAGKSTLFNQLSGSDVWVADQLFATLDPTVRRVDIPQVGNTVLVDTVGFIQQLPHDLVEAFRGTLEETRLAHLLLHVIDASDPQYTEKQESVQAVLKQIGADEIPQLWVYNKIDKLDIEPRIDRDGQGLPNRVWISAASDKGLDLLRQAISEKLGSELLNITLCLPPEDGRLRAQLHQHHLIQSETTDDLGNSLLTIRSSASSLEQLFTKENKNWQDYMKDLE